MDVETVRQAAPHRRLLDAQVALEAVLDLIRLQAEERLALVDICDAPDVLLLERRHAVDGDALEDEERRVDDDEEERRHGREHRDAFDEAARTAPTRRVRPVLLLHRFPAFPCLLVPAAARTPPLLKALRRRAGIPAPQPFPYFR